jgi:hypothetical protein
VLGGTASLEVNTVISRRKDNRASLKVNTVISRRKDSREVDAGSTMLSTSAILAIATTSETYYVT